VRGASYELADGTTVRVDGLLLDMWRVFEDFVTVGLAEALRPYGGRAKLQDEKHHLDEARRVRLRQDFVTTRLRANLSAWQTPSTRSRRWARRRREPPRPRPLSYGTHGVDAAKPIAINEILITLGHRP
jgi:hypothetical protein